MIMVENVVNGVERIAKDEKGNYGTIHILRKHIFRIFGPPSSPLRKPVFSSKNKKKIGIF